jgi:PucR C-terminal helix-turn-helix domain
VAERLGSFVRRQLNDVESLLAQMVVRFTSEMPVISDLSTERQVAMYEWLRRLTTAILETLADDGPLDELGPMIEQMARRRRAQGIELWQTLQSYEVVELSLLDLLVDRLRGHPREASLAPQVTRRLMELQRVTTMWVTAGYSSPAERRGGDRDAQMQTLLEIRAGRRPLPVSVDDDDLARRLELSLPLTEVTVGADRTPEGLDEGLRSTSRANRWGVVGVLDGRLVTLTVRAPVSFPAPSGTARVREGAGPQEVAAAVRSAARAADVARALGAEQFSAAAATPLAALLTLPAPDRTAYLEDCFGALPGTERGRALLGSVAAALTHPRPADAARALHVHRHTLDYRLDRFRTETGLDLGDPITRFRCSIALFLLGLMPYRPAGSDRPAGTGPERAEHPAR